MALTKAKLIELIESGEIEVGNVFGDVGRSYKIVAGTIRNTGSGWYALDDSGHTPIGISGVSNNNDSVVINYSFNIKKAVSFIVTPDETFSAMGLHAGASVGVSSSIISITEAEKTVGGYVSFNTTTQNFTLSGDLAITESTEMLTGRVNIYGKNFDALMKSPSTPFLGSVSGRHNGYRPVIGALGVTANSIYVGWINAEGEIVNTFDSQCVAFFSRTKPISGVDPTKLVSASGNFWFYGIFEV